MTRRSTRVEFPVPFALGYANDSHRLSSHRATREPVASFATFYDSEVSRRVDSA
jgi:hypothetical protein